jgi:hypothetical protein
MPARAVRERERGEREERQKGGMSATRKKRISNKKRSKRHSC